MTLSILALQFDNCRSEQVRRSAVTEMTHIMRALGDPQRMRAMMALAEGELCLCQLIELLELAPSSVSRHLKMLEAVGLLVSRKEGKWRYYRWARQGPSAVRGVLRLLQRELEEDAAVQADRAKLEKVVQVELETLCECYR